jgi:DNA-binding SARP family transcriptional activator
MIAFSPLCPIGEKSMSSLKASLFGRLNMQQGDLKIKGIQARKVQELLGYLLLFREHPQSRELLCEILWGDRASTDSRKQLRQTLWRLQSALKMSTDSTELELRIDNDWIQISVSSDFWLDIAEFEKVFNLVKGKNARELSIRDHKMLEYATDLYKGDLLEGWYTDWCVFERDRFQTMHLLLLDKLVQFSELHQNYEAGLAFGIEILRQDHAYERTHRQLMRLYFMAGNRTQALHQYEHCVIALRNELGVEPSERTKQLYEQIRLDNFKPPYAEEKAVFKTKVRAAPSFRDALHRLEEVSQDLSRLEHKIQAEIAALGDMASG